MDAMEVCNGMKAEPVMWPIPRRARVCRDPIVRSTGFSYGEHGGDARDFAAGAELLDIILAKGGYGGERFGAHIASSPPYFKGSPPCRVSNPVIQDAHLGIEHFVPMSTSSPSPSMTSSGHNSGGGGGDRGGCVRNVNLRHKTPNIRIEGFDCLGRDIIAVLSPPGPKRPALTGF